MNWYQQTKSFQSELSIIRQALRQKHSSIVGFHEIQHLSNSQRFSHEHQPPKRMRQDTFNQHPNLWRPSTITKSTTDSFHWHTAHRTWHISWHSPIASFFIRRDTTSALHRDVETHELIMLVRSYFQTHIV